MITAVDFGCSVVRCLFRDPAQRNRLKLFAERSEYAAIASAPQHLRSLLEEGIPFADCDGALVVVGNDVARAKWLSRVPLTSLFDDGRVPVDDPPARQLLNVLLESMLPEGDEGSLCALAIPCGDGSSEQTVENQEFLCRLVQMRGYEPLVIHPATAAVLSTCAEAAFRGIGIVVGAQSCSIAIARYGMPVAETRIAVGSDWIDQEVARQFSLHSYDDSGVCYLDVQQVRNWRITNNVYLRNPTGERDTVLNRLYTALLDRITRCIAQLLSTDAVRNAMGDGRLAVTVAGGPCQHAGFAGMFTEQLVKHGIADRVAAMRIADQPETAVIRGALIHAELEAQRIQGDHVAA
jgi:hypothetical protein